MMFASVAATWAEKRIARPGDDLVDPAGVVMDRAFTVPGPPEQVWPRSRRAARAVNPAWLGLRPGDVIPDYGGRHETFEVATITAPGALVYRSRRGHTDVTWSLTLEPATGPPGRTRIFLRLRMAPVRHQRLARTAGELIDLLTVAGMAAGLKERLAAEDQSAC